MMKLVLAACALLCALSVNADASPRHRAAPAQPACVETVMRPCYATSSADLKEARRVARGQYIADQLGYGGVADRPAPRARHSHKGRQTQSYSVPAPSFDYSIARPVRYIAGRLVCSAPVPGAVAVSSRRGGGHVAIVKEVRPDGTIIVFNPSPRGRGWQEVAYRHRAISFRVPG